MNLTRPICFIDSESTGTDPAKDRIVELGVHRVTVWPPTGEDAISVCWRVNPGIPIPKTASEVHGITDELVANEPPFKDVAKFVIQWLSGCDLAGYSLASFDIPILWEEFDRAGIAWDLSGVNIIDAKSIFFKKEQRTLEAAMRFYCGKEHKEAHGALGDAKATADVLAGQLERYGDLAQLDVAQLAEFSHMEEQPRIDLAGKLVRDGDGDAVYNFGPQKGKKLKDETGFAYWMLGKDFSKNTKLHVQAELDKLAKSRASSAH